MFRKPLHFTSALTLGAGSINAGWRHGVTARVPRNQVNRYQRTSNIYTASLTRQFQNQLSLTAGGQYTHNGYRNGLSSDLSVRKTVNVWNRSTELRLGAYQRPSWTSGKKDTGIEIGISIPIFSNSRVHSASAEIGTKDSEGYANLNYNWRPDEPSTLSYLGATSSFSRNSSTAGMNGGVQGRYASGDFYAQTTSGTGGFWSGINLSNTFATGGGKIAAASDLRDASAAVIVDVDSSRKDPGITVVSPAGDVSLRQGRNIISADVWQRRTMQFDGNARESLHVYPPAYSYQMNRGSVGYISVKAVRKKTIVALLTHADGSPILNRETESDIDQAHVNSDGVVTLDVSALSRYIKISGTHSEPAMSCRLPDIQWEKHEIIFIEMLSCKII